MRCVVSWSDAIPKRDNACCSILRVLDQPVQNVLNVCLLLAWDAVHSKFTACEFLHPHGTLDNLCTPSWEYGPTRPRFLNHKKVCEHSVTAAVSTLINWVGTGGTSSIHWQPCRIEDAALRGIPEVASVMLSPLNWENDPGHSCSQEQARQCPAKMASA